MTNHLYYALEDYDKKGSLELDDFLTLAIALILSVQHRHKKNQFFNHLSSSSILICDDFKVKFVNESVSSDLQKVTPYLSPEHMGNTQMHMNQSSEIYSLGVIFYELLLGELPYTSKDILEFSHLKLTQKVPFLSEKDHTIPPIISLIVDKMVAINQEERYTNLISVYVDLSKVFKQLKERNEINNFEINTVCDIQKIHLDKAIYGRENEVKKIQHLIDSKSNLSNKVILVHGKSGMGKSSLIKKVIGNNRDLFVHQCIFKLDLGKQSTPYQSLYMALSAMVRKLIVKDEVSLINYKTKLLNILGTQAYELIDVIPEIEILIGKKPQSTNEKMTDRKINLDNLLMRLMEIFVDLENPLCIYVDDIQWVDTVTLQWLKNVILNLENIILFMNYREDGYDTSENDILTSLLEEFSSIQMHVDTIHLLALNKTDIVTLIHHHIPLKSANEVAQIIFERTGGNPFFVKAYLKKLYDDNAIWFDMQHLEWKCNLQKIEALQISDNVFDILSNNIDMLPKSVQNLLGIASCIGHSFSHDLLQKVFNNSPLFDQSLAFAIASGWIKIDGSNKSDDAYYRFLHDKMQQTMHTFLAEKVRIKLHYKIGCYLDEDRKPLDHKNLLECVKHLNLGAVYVRDKLFLGNLNLEAGVYAKKSGDFQSALAYIKKSMELMFLKTSTDNRVMMLKERAECEHLCNHSAEAIHYYEKALELATSRLQKAQIYELLIKLYSDISQFHKAYEVGRKAVKSFGITLPKKFIPPLFIAEFLHLKIKLRSYATNELINLPNSKNEDFIMTIKLLANILQAAYQIQPELSVANALIIVKLCLKHGLTKESVIGFTVFGVIFQGAILGNHQQGYDYSKLSFDMLDKFENTTQHAEVKFVCGYFALSWKQAAFESEINWKNAYRNGLEIGDWFHTGCAAAGIVQSMFMRGVSFEEILREIKNYENTLMNIGAKEQHGALLSVKQSLMNLMGETPSKTSYNTQGFDESSYVNSLENYESKHFAHYYFINKMLVLYIHESYQEAQVISEEGKRFAKSSKGMLHHTEYLFYEALIVAKLMSAKDFMTVKSYKRTIELTKKKFMKWAEGCAENFLVRAYMLQAESYRVHGNHEQAFIYYDKAIDLAHIYGQKHLAALANRLSSKLYEDLGQLKAAKMYKNDALASFNAWGMKYSLDGNTDEEQNIDVATLIRASEVISSEYEFSNLLKTLIRIIMKNAGAQHGFLLLEKNGEYVVQASGNEDLSGIEVMQELPYAEVDSIVHPVITYVLRTKEPIVIDDMSKNNIFDTSYISPRLIKSVLCAPLILHGDLKGIIYLENNLSTSVFTTDKVKFLQHLSGKIVISIENTMMFDRLEEKIKQRTKDLEESKEELKLLASIDPMTQLYNRRYFSEISENIFKMNQRAENNITIIMIDIDDFKNINDTYGHSVGDKVIIGVASILLQHIRKSDIVCRYGGEEYILLMPNTALKDSIAIAESIRKLVENMVIVYDSDKQLRVTISLGVSLVDIKRETNIETSINKADNALYEAKRSGKNRVSVYQENDKVSPDSVRLVP